ncbi:LysM peptidoglycan-binding domain-containing protein [Lactobacillus helveticus]|uniref:LysM peptidoglycan-binding domain-containing protein n=1 Tax=Lactobacillus helveticus TaxID=1587 RepID=UPI00062A97A6|nr:LysM domain-containing protein [Lactobacillus helveticus]AKG66652.1 hypothetical protein TU99_04870 [Lactobacillus helveticus]
MNKKEKPKNKSKPYKGRKKTTAEIKISKKVDDLEKKAEYAHRNALQANKKSLDFAEMAFNAKNAKDKAKYSRLTAKYLDKYKACIKKYKNYKRQINKARTKKRRVVKTRTTDQSAMASIIQEHSKEFTGEGNMAIFPTKNGQESDVVFFAPVNTESESNSSNVTSYAVDQGAPRKSYARFSSKTVTIDGLIADADTGTAHDKWVKLRTWHSNHEELTFSGDIYYKHLIISQLDRQFTGYQNTMQVSITFTFVRAAEITTSNQKKKHAKRSKSSKTVAGNRKKKYTAITIKQGDTLWGLAQQYGTSVSWLQKVNHIKNPNRIFAGNPIYVNDRKHKAKSKVRVK